MKRGILLFTLIAVGCGGEEEEADGSCEVDGEIYEDGERVSEDDYHPCDCEDGEVVCQT